MADPFWSVVWPIGIMWGFCAMVDLGVSLFILWVNHVWKQRRS